MKILLIHNKYQQAGGEDAVVFNEGELLSKNGHCVEQMFFDNNTIKSWTYRLLYGIQAAYNLGSARAIQKKIDYFSPHVIHVHNFTPLVSPSVFFVANKNKIPIIVTLHNYRLLCPSATLFYNNSIYEKSIHTFFPWDAVRKGVYRNSVLETAALAFITTVHNTLGTWRNRVDRYITLTSFAKDKFKNSSLSIADEKLVVKPNFVENKGRGESSRKNFFLFVGRLTEEKGIRTLLKACEKSNFKLTIIGDGPLRKLVEDSALINNNITYLGHQSSEIVLHSLKSCKALLFPSIWYEGFPITILEAFSTGTVVVASKLGGMAEIIQDHVNGLHFEAGNADDLVRKISEISEHAELSKIIEENAYATYLKYYTPQKNYEQLTAIYNEAIAQKTKKYEHNVHKQNSELKYA